MAGLGSPDLPRAVVAQHSSSPHVHRASTNITPTPLLVPSLRRSMLTVQVCSPCGEVLSDAWVSLVDPSSPALCASPAAVPGRPLDSADKGAAKPSTTVALKTERTFADVAKVVGFIVRAELAGHVQRVAAPPIAPSSEAGEDQVSVVVAAPAAAPAAATVQGRFLRATRRTLTSASSPSSSASSASSSSSSCQTR